MCDEQERSENESEWVLRSDDVLQNKAVSSQVILVSRKRLFAESAEQRAEQR